MAAPIPSSRTDPFQQPGSYQQRARGSQRRQQGGKVVEHDADHKDPLAAVDICQPADGHQKDGRRQQIGRRHPA